MASYARGDLVRSFEGWKPPLRESHGHGSDHRPVEMTIRSMESPTNRCRLNEAPLYHFDSSGFMDQQWIKIEQAGDHRRAAPIRFGISAERLVPVSGMSRSALWRACAFKAPEKPPRHLQSNAPNQQRHCISADPVSLYEQSVSSHLFRQSQEHLYRTIISEYFITLFCNFDTIALQTYRLAMGRHATDVPTPDSVQKTIATLKPAKRIAWEQDARSRNYPFRTVCH